MHAKYTNREAQSLPKVVFLKYKELLLEHTKLKQRAGHREQCSYNNQHSYTKTIVTKPACTVT